MAYAAEFIDAKARTSTWGLKVDNIPADSKRYVSPATTEQIAACMAKNLGHLTAEQIAAQCFAVSAFLKEPLEKIFDMPLIYTIGHINLNKRNVFYTENEALKQMLDAGKPSSFAMNLHAWLTLPSHEIIDLTLHTTYGVANNINDLIGGLTFIHPDNLMGDQSYHPQLLGDDFFRRIGVMIEISGVML